MPSWKVPSALPEWLEKFFYIEDPVDPVTGDLLPPGPIRLFPHQRRILTAMTERDGNGRFRWTTLLYSTVKKSGKTRLAAGIVAWLAAQYGPYAECYVLANDGKQSDDRLLSAVRKANNLNKSLDWHESKRAITLPDGSFIEAIPVDPEGESGANPTAVVFCVDEDTEILTRKGWKCYATLYDDDEVATLSPERMFEWQRPRAIHRSWYEGEMIGVDVCGFSLLVTPEHRLHGSFYKTKNALQCGNADHEGLMPAEEVAANYHGYRPTLRTDGWVGEEPEPVLIPATDRRPEISIDPMLFAEFLGWFLSEGSLSRKHGRPEGVLIGQCEKTNPEKRSAILTLIRQMGFRPCEWADRINIAIWDTRLAHYCDQFGKAGEKYVPGWLKNAPRQYLRAFLDAYLAGDGTINSATCFTISSTSGEMSDDLVEIGQKLGFRTKSLISSDNRWGDEPKIIYGITFSCGGNRPRVRKKDWKRIDYKGHIYCPSTDNGIILVRRKGSCYWTGNSELWGYGLQYKERFWATMTISPAKHGRSLRVVETYAGYEGESPTLERLYEQGVTLGKRHPDFPDLPVFINESAGLITYWDEQPRMPWQTDAYYAQEASMLPHNEFLRLHRNQWVRSEDTFVPVAWWDSLKAVPPLPPLQKGEKIIIGADAAVSGACFGLVAVTRHPDPKRKGTDVAIRLSRKWAPPRGGKIDFAAKDGPEETVREWAKDYRVLEVAYDQYQLHRTATQMNQERVCFWKPFGQQTDRLISDSQLYHLIRDGRLAHDGDADLREHLKNCNAKTAVGEDTRMRIVQRNANSPIDLMVAAGMAAKRCLELRMG